jgi:hypothetical protein
MNSIDPCNKSHMSNFLKDYSKSQINKLLDTHKSLLLSSKVVKDMKYKTDDYQSCVDPIRKHNPYDKYQS